MRRLCRGLAVSFPLLFLIAGIFLSNTHTVSAQASTEVDKIGTHLIEGDEGGQKKVLDALDAAGLKSPSYPVVVMVYPGDKAGVSLLSRGYLAIARVNIDCTTKAGDLASLAVAIPAGTPVTIGNEINNQNPVNGEWKNCDYGTYATLFNAFASAWGEKGPLGISTMDTINGDYDAATTLNQIFSSGINSSKITAVFANVYQAGGCRPEYEATRCTVNGGQWVLSKINSLTGRNFSTAQLYITEFGVTTCKDFDCVQDFYVQNNDQPAAAKVGFLRSPTNPDSGNTDWYHTVPAICQYWHHGDLAVEKPEKCGGSKRQAFIYPGIEDMIPDTGKMMQMAAGYTLTCGNQMKIKGDINDSAISTYNANHPTQQIDCGSNPPNGACMVGGVWANVIIDSTKAVIPLYRFQGAQVPNPDSPKRRLDDLEGFFGANYSKDQLANATVDLKDELITPLANGVSKKIVSQEAQCQNTLQYLQTIKQLCDDETNRSPWTYNDKLDADLLKATSSTKPKPVLPTGECALYSKIPGAPTQYNTYKKVLDQVPKNFSCASLDTPTVTERDWYRAFSKIEITTPRGFKPAYLVHYIDRPESPITSLDKRINWMAPGESTNGGTSDPRNVSDRIKIVKVYVPAGFAETNIASVNSNPDLEAKEKQPSFFPTYTGVFMQTIASLMPLDLQTQVAKTRALVIDKIIKAMPGSDTGAAIKCDSCATQAAKDPADPRFTIIRRINAGLATSGQDLCTHDDLVGETAVERTHTINPAGTLDLVKSAKITASATLIAQKPGSEPETIRTFLLLPEEYRNITDYETPFLQTFLPYDENQAKNHPELSFITYESERAANPKAAYKYLQLTGAATSIVNPVLGDTRLTYDVFDPNAPPVVDPLTGVITRNKHFDDKITGQLNLEKNVSITPQVPGGKLTRTLWEVICNVTRPFNNKATIPYPGFEKFLQQGLAACTQGATGTAATPGAALCSGTTILPTHSPGDYRPLKALVTEAATSVGIPPEYLWGVMKIEGGKMLTAYDNNQTTVACTANSVGAVGLMQVLVGACGAPYDNWTTYSAKAGISGTSPCDITASLKVAATMLKFNYAAQAHPNCSPNYPNASAEEKKWMNAAGAYYGSCKILDPKNNCVNDKGVSLTYGECAIKLFAPSY